VRVRGADTFRVGSPRGRRSAFVLGLVFAAALLLGAGWIVATWVSAVPLLAGAYRAILRRERGMYTRRKSTRITVPLSSSVKER